jgi:hypothetical protein
LRLDLISTTVKMTGVEQNRTIEREIACYNLRSVIESRHVLCGVLYTPQIEGYCEIPTPPLSSIEVSPF